jgi:1-acyl-sn-glycerol-3-phosphate acyltransferase
MLIVRSCLFNIAFYINLLFWMILGLPALILPRRWFIRLAKAWAGTSLWLLRVVAGVDVEWRGREHISNGALLVASKHQSAWETFALFVIFDDPAFVMKRELMWIPFFGWYAMKGKMIALDREATAKGMTTLITEAQKAITEGRQIILFPEGTRRVPNAPAYSTEFRPVLAASQFHAAPWHDCG